MGSLAAASIAEIFDGCGCLVSDRDVTRACVLDHTAGCGSDSVNGGSDISKMGYTAF